MHMADALISPVTGGILWAVSAALLTVSSQRMRACFDSRLIPLMGVLGAFIFAAQMINFTIPGTGSSGHLGGGLLLAILLGPYAGFLTITSVLTIQALFFADGGLLALGCNIFNLGFFPCFVVYPFLYKPLAGLSPTRKSLSIACVVGAIASLQLGAFSVVLETVASGITELPFASFALLMQPIHLLIGLVEGLVTAAVVTFIYNARPDLLQLSGKTKTWSIGKLAATFALLALVVGGFFSSFVSSDPDGLEWSIQNLTGKEELPAPDAAPYNTLATLQEKTAIMPDYAFREPAISEEMPAHTTPPAPSTETSDMSTAESTGSLPTLDTATGMAGLTGGVLTLILTLLLGFFLRRRARHE